MRSKLSQFGFEDPLFIFLLAFAPLALASVHTWAYCLVSVIALILFDKYFFDNPRKLLQLFKIPAVLGITVFAAITFIYILPLPKDIIKVISPAAFHLRKEYMFSDAYWQTLSVYPRATMGYLMKTLSYMMIFCVTVSKMISGKCDNGEENKIRAFRPEDKVSGGTHRNVNPEENSNRENRLKLHINRATSDFILLGSLTGILSILLHSLSDFNLHIPANALYFTVILAILTALSSAKHRDVIDYVFLNKLVSSIVIIGFVIAVFGVVQRLGSNGKIYWVIAKQGGHFGPYINYDHYAGYMEMCIFIGIASFFAKVSETRFVHLKRFKERLVWFSSEEANKTFLSLFFIVVMGAALFMTTSRGGILSFSGALAVFYFTCIITASKTRRKRILLTSVLIAMLIGIMLLWIGPDEIIVRFRLLHETVRFFIVEMTILSEIRPSMWKDTIVLIKDYYLSGSGLGTFGYIFPAYRTFTIEHGFLKYAHNDYLQFLSEMGVIALVLTAGFLTWFSKKFAQCIEKLKKHDR